MLENSLNEMSQCYALWPEASFLIHLQGDGNVLMGALLTFCSLVLFLHAPPSSEYAVCVKCYILAFFFFFFL